MKQLIDKLEKERHLTKEEYISLIDGRTPELAAYLFEKAQKTRKKFYDNDVYMRGLIEFTSYCKNDCYYCGLRKSNRNAERYRLTKEQIMECCAIGYELGFRTFVLQGGEDPAFRDEVLVDIIQTIKSNYPDCALTLSVGEKSYESYLSYYNAGADRYLLRHETADPVHYSKLHPKELTFENRERCLRDLKKIGFQVGTGFMVGSPYQTTENLAKDLLFIEELSPEMVGIGPFIPHHDTPFAEKKGDNGELTLFLLAIIRLLLPSALIPATTALGTIDSEGREKGILAGANVVMPNLSPLDVRKKYLLYDNKICTGDEAAECHRSLEQRMNGLGYDVVISRGDFKSEKTPQ